MAQPIQCDAHNMEHLADWLVTRLEDGEVMAYCTPGYLAFMEYAIDAAAQSEIETTDTDALARLQATGSLDDAAGAELDAAAIEARLDPQPAEQTIEVAGMGQVPSVGTDELIGAQDAGESDPTPQHVVRRGQGSRARAHQARVAAGSGDVMPADAAGPGDDDEDDDGEDDDAPTP